MMAEPGGSKVKNFEHEPEQESSEGTGYEPGSRAYRRIIQSAVRPFSGSRLLACVPLR
jgi:hypothetical protein